MIYVGMNESGFRVAPQIVCWPKTAMGWEWVVNMKLWRGSCFDVQSSIHRKPCPAKIGLSGELWKLGVAVSWWVHQARDTHPCQKSDAVGTSFLRSRGPSFFFLSRPCATGRSQEIIDGRITLL